MKVLIFEDEHHTARHLSRLLKSIKPGIQIVAIINTIKTGIKWFEDNNPPDLIFQDIMLSDGNCFELFEQVNIEVPIIFTTAFSEYALQSFRVNSIDYIVKPYDVEDIGKAIAKYENLKGVFQAPKTDLLKEILHNTSFVPKKRFLIKKGNNFISVNSENVAFLRSEDSITFATLFNEDKHIVDKTIIELSTLLDPAVFFQINRKLIVNIQSVKKIHSWFSSRLKIDISPKINDEIIVSRDRVKAFKHWLDK